MIDFSSNNQILSDAGITQDLRVSGDQLNQIVNNLRQENLTCR
jgi:hypothetical protein